MDPAWPEVDSTVPLLGPGEGGPQPPTFAHGELVAGRYRIARFVARGGMGEVYEAEDRELCERVALKTIAPHLCSYGRTIERFKREIQLARRVTHPNVCRIFDVGFHDRDRDRIWFLTMELLAGQTLAQRLRRRGAMSAEDAWPIVRQLCAALAAAHQAGVVHRDFKSDNILLVARPEAEGGVRAVVTDFGIAQGAGPAPEPAASEGPRSALAGTPAYMAPEQVEGADITAAADLYALGVVLYEMVTGTLPFLGPTPLETARQRLEQTPPPPRSRAPRLDARWDAAILRCLARQPKDRFGSAAEVARALGASSRRVRVAAFAALAFALVAGAVGLHAATDRGPAATRALRSAPRRSVAVLGFRNLSGQPEAAWLSTALSEMLSTELGAGERLRVVPGENVSRMKQELALPDAESLGRETLARIRAHVGADLVVAGAYLDSGHRIRLDVRVQDTASGELQGALVESGLVEELADLASRATVRLRRQLGAGGAAGDARASAPKGTEAARLYAEGLFRLRLHDAQAARDLLAQAAAADPQYAPIRSALAAAWAALGYDGRARVEAQRAFQLAGPLPREQRLAIEGRFCETARQWARAIEIYRTLFDFFPDNVEYGLRLAAVQVGAGAGKDALATVEALRKLPAPDSDQARIDLAEAAAAGSLSQLRRQQEVAVRAAARGQALGAQGLRAQALLYEGRALDELGEPAQAMQRLADAERLFRAAGDRAGAARTLTAIGRLLARQGDHAAAQARFEESLATSREIGDQGGVARALTNLANVAWYRGQLTRARQIDEQALALCRQIDDKAGLARISINLAIWSVEQGDVASARARYLEARALALETGEITMLIQANLNLGMLESEHGNPADARKRYQEALASSREIGDRSGAADALECLGNLLAEQDDLAGAKAHYEEALAILTALAQRGQAALVRVDLADLILEQGRAREAEAMARDSVTELQAEKAVRQEALARLVLARALLAQARLGEAQAAIRRAAELVQDTPKFRPPIAITDARIRAAAGGPEGAAEALRRLQAVLVEATRSSQVVEQLEARLALGEIELRWAHRASGRSRLRAVEREAAALGYARIARKAAQLWR